MGLRGPQPNRPRARIYVTVAGMSDELLFDGLDPETCLEFQIAANDMGWAPGRLLDQQMRSFLARRNSERNTA